MSREPAKRAELVKEDFFLSDRKILRSGSTRWLNALEKMDPESDPIFAPWFAFAALPSSGFSDRAKELSARIAANSLARPLNSLVARTFAGEPPASLKEVAERYAKLFADVDKRWQAKLKRDTETHTTAAHRSCPKASRKGYARCFMVHSPGTSRG